MPVCSTCSMEFDDGEERCPFCGAQTTAASHRSIQHKHVIGQELPGGYVVKERLASGGMATVYRAEQVALGRSVAVKVMHPHLLHDETTAVRFMNEARAASRLNHPHTLSVIDFGKMQDGRPYMIMEFLRGENLDVLARKDGPLPFHRIIEILLQLLDALSEAHDLDIIHRDLKPENIIIESLRSGEDFVKVVDFGLAKIITDAEDTGVTGTGTVCGTPDFMSPEQCQAKKLDGRSDIYAVGINLFFLLTNRVPFLGNTPMETLVAHVTKPAPDPREVAPERKIPEALAAACLRAMEKEPDKRFQTAEQFSHALEAVRTQLMAETARISMSPMQRTRCPTCGGWSMTGSKFCGECGAPLTQTGATLRTIPPNPSAVSPASARDMRSISGLPLIGRTDAVLGLLDLLQGGSRQNALIVGKRGVGKTSVLEAFSKLATRRGHQVYWARPDPWRRFVPLSPLQQLAKQIVAPAELEEVVAANADVRSLLNTTSANAQGMSDMSMLVRTINWLLQHAHNKSPDASLVLVADDLHNFDSVTQAVLGAVATEQTSLPLFVLGTAPHADAATWPDQIPGVELPEMLPEDAHRLLLFAGVPEALVPSFDAPQLPLFLEHTAAGIIGGMDYLPNKLGDLIASRIARMNLQQRKILQYLAVLPESFPISRLQKLFSDETTFPQDLQDLRKGRFVRLVDEHVYLAHDIVREMVLGTTPVEVMRKVYARVDDFMANDALPLEVRAYYSVGTEDSFQALLLLDQAAAHAYRRGDMAGTIRLLQDALNFARSELSRGMLDNPMQAVVLFGRKLGEVLLRTHNLNDAEGILNEALGFADRNHPETVRVLTALGDVWRQRAQFDQARELYERAFAQVTHLNHAGTHPRAEESKLLRRLQRRLKLVNEA